MKRYTLIVFSMFIAFNAIGQKVYNLSIITKQQFVKHKAECFIFKKPKKNLKINGLIKIKKLQFKDDGEFAQYTNEGELPGEPMILIRKLEPNLTEYYLVNSSTSKIDTLISKPNFYRNTHTMLCYTRVESDSPEKIEIVTLDYVNRVKKRVLNLNNSYNLEAVYWYNKNTIYIKTFRKGYYKISF